MVLAVKYCHRVHRSDQKEHSYYGESREITRPLMANFAVGDESEPVSQVTDQNTESAGHKESLLHEACAWTFDRVGNPQNSWKPAIVDGATQVLKSAPLFVRGSGALPMAAFVSMLDEIKSKDSWKEQAIDGLLGVTKGSLQKWMLNKASLTGLGIGAQSGWLGVGARAIDTGLTRQNYLDDAGKFSFSGGVNKVTGSIFSPTAIVADVASVYTGSKLLGRVDKLVDGRIIASPMLSTMAGGALFGLTSGTAGEIQRELLNKERLDPVSVLQHGLISGMINGIAATPGALQSRRAYLSGSMFQSEARSYDYWKEYRDFRKTDTGTIGTVPGRIIPESLSYDEYKALSRFRLKPQTIIDAKREINKLSVEPEQALIGELKQNRVLALGETHVSPNPNRTFGAKILPKLAAAGATDLALELPVQSQPHLNEYVNTGKIHPAIKSLFGQHHWQVVEQARKSGMRLLAVDNLHDMRNRDQFMADKIAAHLSENPNSKIVFWVGQRHLSDAKLGNKQSEIAKTDHVADTGVKQAVNSEQFGKFIAEHFGLVKTRAAALLRNEAQIPVATTIDATLMDQPLYIITSELKHPIAIPLNKASTLARMDSSPLPAAQNQYGNFNYALAYPHQEGTQSKQLASYLSQTLRALPHRQFFIDNGFY